MNLRLIFRKASIVVTLLTAFPGQPGMALGFLLMNPSAYELVVEFGQTHDEAKRVEIDALSALWVQEASDDTALYLKVRVLERRAVEAFDHAAVARGDLAVTAQYRRDFFENLRLLGFDLLPEDLAYIQGSEDRSLSRSLWQSVVAGMLAGRAASEAGAYSLAFFQQSRLYGEILSRLPWNTQDIFPWNPVEKAVEKSPGLFLEPGVSRQLRASFGSRPHAEKNENQVLCDLILSGTHCNWDYMRCFLNPQKIDAESNEVQLLHFIQQLDWHPVLFTSEGNIL